MPKARMYPEACSAGCSPAPHPRTGRSLAPLVYEGGCPKGRGERRLPTRLPTEAVCQRVQPAKSIRRSRIPQRFAPGKIFHIPVREYFTRSQPDFTGRSPISPCEAPPGRAQVLVTHQTTHRGGLPAGASRQMRFDCGGTPPLHRGCGKWKTFLWTNGFSKIRPKPLWKP